MDIETKFKLVNLGWNTRDKIPGFFKRKYKVTFHRLSMLLIVKYEIKPGVYSCVSFSYPEDRSIKTEDFIIEKILTLFRTENGVVIGPNSEFILAPEEWT